MDPSRIAFAKLTGTANYSIWSIKMQSYLIAQDLWQVIDISPSSNADHLKSLNSKVMSIIIMCCEDHVIRLLNINDLAASAWIKLERQYGQIGFSSRHLAFQSLVSTTLSSCINVDQFIGQFRSHVSTLSQISSVTLPQWLLLSILINNAGNVYEAWSQSIMQQVRTRTISEDSDYYLEEVIASLIDEARRVTSSIPSTESNSNTALMSRKPNKSKPICKHCGKIHKSENCWQMFPEKKPMARYSSAQNQNSDDNHNDQDNNKMDHDTYRHPSPDNIAFLSQRQAAQYNDWVLDSGASQHMCKDKTQFTNFTTCSTSVTIADNSKMDATGRGDIQIMTQNGKSFTLQNVLYVPQLASNLISVTRATQNPNIHFNFSKDRCQIMFQDTIIATADQENCLLVLKTIPTRALVSTTPDTLTWHKRLGHLNKDYLTKTSKQTSIGPVSDFSCEVCLKNKSTRNISRSTPIKATRPLEKIHSDIAGPITPISLGGNKYVITFTDDYSRYSWVNFMNEKSECLNMFQIFKKAVETEFSRKIAFLHCDNGGEYSSNAFKRFAHQEGIQIQYTVPHTPEQNGVAERLNRTLFDMTRCFLNDTPRLPKSLWAEMVRTSCYIKNRLPTAANHKFQSPYEKLFRRQPEISHLKIIGSTCYNHQTGKISGKLNERSSEGLLVGYETSNIFRIFDPATNKVSRARDVIICEGTSDKQIQIHESITDPNLIYTELNPHSSGSRTIPEMPQNIQSPTRSANTPSLFDQKYLSIPGHFRSSSRFYSPDSTIDELADPQYDQQPQNARVFVAQCLIAADAGTALIPEYFEQAMTCKDSQQWGESMRDEIKSVMENSTWKLVPPPQDGTKVIQGRWVYQTKTDLHGNITRYKSRWVVKGFQQEEGTSYTDTFACVVKPMSYKILFSIAASLDLHIEQMDVKTAFLNSPISENVYVEQPYGFEVNSKAEEEILIREILSSTPNSTNTFPRQFKTKARLVCKLSRALYGLKQAPRAWYTTLKDFFHQCGLEPLKCDYAVFINVDRTLLIAVYVDDLLIFGKVTSQIQYLKMQLKDRFQMTDLGPAHMYLGMQISRDRISRVIYVDQQKYIRVILKRFNMQNCNAVRTPMEMGLKLVKRIDTASPQDITEYQKIIGCLEYAACATRPDITFAVHALAQFASNPDSSHFNAAKRVLRYLKGTEKFCLVFKGSQTSKFTLHGFTDADWAADTNDRKSIGGYCFYLNDSLVSHMSKKQRTVALSTAESETHAAMQATKEAIWLRNLLEELGYKQRGATTIFCDNQAAIALSRNPEFHSRSKHVDIQYHFLRYHVENHTVDLKYVGSEDMAADGLTKPLTQHKHNRFCEYMQGKF